MSGVAVLPLSRDPSSASEARRFVTSFLSEAGLGQLAEAGELVTTELVTNVLVHTDTVPTVRVAVADETVRVEVEDGCPVVPVAGILDTTAASGRGLVLVEQLTHRWGVSRLPDAGKVIWFELDSGAPQPAEELSADALLDLWDDVATWDLGDDESPAPAPAGQVRHVRLEDVPTALLNSTKTHLDDLVRDFALMDVTTVDEDLRELSDRLCELVNDLVGFRNQIRRFALEAARRDEPVMTLELDLPVALRGPLAEYRRSLDEAEEHCAAGRLLVAVPPPEQVEFRRWKLDRIIEQLGDAQAV